MKEKTKAKESARGDLRENIHVIRPGMLIIIIGLVLILVSAAIWSIFGRIPVTQTANGLIVTDKDEEKEPVYDNDYYCGCFLDANTIGPEICPKEGQEVVMTMPDGTPIKGVIDEVSEVPVPKTELGDDFMSHRWLADELVPSNYNWSITIRQKDLVNWRFNVVKVSFVIDEVSPINLLLG